MNSSKTNFFFWICVIGGIVDLLIGVVISKIPQLAHNTDIFLMSAIMLAVGAIANYVNSIQKK